VTGERWSVARAHGPAGPFHARELPEPLTRTAWVLSVPRPALVLGSTQPDAVVDLDAARTAGIEVVRRRSGGGAVLLQPAEALWVDLLVPRHDALWVDDVGRAAYWLGDAWAAALAGLGIEATAHRGGFVPTRWSRWICFAALGPGEVTVSGRKVVGVSQRRTRAGARLQCVVLARWEPEVLLSLLALSSAERREAADELRGVAAAVAVPLAALEREFVRHLPT